MAPLPNGPGVLVTWDTEKAKGVEYETIVSGAQGHNLNQRKLYLNCRKHLIMA